MIESAEVEEFCIGVTDDPSALKVKKVSDEIIVLHRAGSPGEARAMADELARDFGTSEKCSNKEGHAVEESSGGPATYVCLAIWYRERQGW